MDDLRLPFTERLSTHQWTVVDVVLAALLAAAAAAEIALGRLGVPTGPSWTVIRYLAVATACVSLPFRRRFPVAVLGVVAVSVAFLNALGTAGLTAAPGGLAMLAVTLAVYSMAATSTMRASLTVAAAGVGAIEIGALTVTGGPDWGAALLALALAAAGWLAGENARARRTYVQGMVERAAEREREREQQARRAGAEERLRIARELHDVVAHAMSIIAVRSGVARLVLDVRPEEARETLGIIEDTSRQALQEMRLLVGVLRSSDVEDTSTDREPAPGLADLPDLITQMIDAGVAVGVHVEGEPRRLSPGVDLSAYRIVQEALTNVVRHASPASAELTLRYRPAEVVIEVTDDGRACPRTRSRTQAQKSAGHGLLGMRERVTIYGGKLLAEPTPSGFRVLARIPTEEDVS